MWLGRNIDAPARLLGCLAADSLQLQVVDPEWAFPAPPTPLPLRALVSGHLRAGFQMLLPGRTVTHHSSLVAVQPGELALIVGSVKPKLAVSCVCKTRALRGCGRGSFRPWASWQLFPGKNPPPPLPLVLLPLPGRAGSDACSQAAGPFHHPGCPVEAMPTSPGGHPGQPRTGQPCRCAAGLRAAAAVSLILSAASLAGPPSLLPRASALPSALFLLEERAGTLALALPPSCLLECSVWWPRAAWRWLRQWGTGHTSGMPAPQGQAPLASPRLHFQHPGQHWAWSRAQGTWVNR